MLYFIITLIMVAVWYYFFVYRKKKLFREMDSAVKIVQMGVYERLRSRYKNKYGKEGAGLLAAAIMNELFSYNPANEKAKEYFANYKTIIHDELKKIPNDREMCEMVTQTVRVVVVVACAKNLVKNEIAHLEKLKKLGILIPGGEAPYPITFLPKAYEYFDKFQEKPYNEQG